jgi:hypothetical protein
MHSTQISTLIVTRIQRLERTHYKRARFQESIGTRNGKRNLIFEMTHSLKTSLSHWFQLRFITFGLAVFNFVLVWTLDAQMRGIAAMVDPWYHPWSYFNEPTRLLLAASLLLVDRIWGYLGAIGISGYLFIRFVYLFAVWKGQWVWTFQSRYDPHFIGTYESQILLGFIVLCVGLHGLSRVVLLRRDKITASLKLGRAG